MIRLFLSYRRSDTRKVIKRIYNHLRRVFGKHVFIDVQSIKLGVDFRIALRQSILEAHVVVVVIGNDWVNVRDEQGNLRLFNPNDPVRFEIEQALARGEEDCRVVPLLINTAMPKAEQLPPSLRPLIYRHGGQVVRDDPEFEADMRRFAKTLYREMQAFSQGAGRQSSSLNYGSTDELSDILVNSPMPDLEDTRPWDGELGSGGGQWMSPVVVLKDTPQLEWSLVPPNRVQVQGRWYSIPQFSIATTPLTNAQYAAFLRAKDGYCKADWWNFSPAARYWRMEHPNPTPSPFEDEDDLPRVMLSWFDAMAYARWLSQRLKRRIVLPTEQYWQSAALGYRSEGFAWGEQFDPLRACFGGVHQRPSSVYAYRQGASACGALQMCGNVWELCANDFVALNDYNESADCQWRSVRGGAWDSMALELLAHYRQAISPDIMADNVGVRLACLD